MQADDYFSCDIKCILMYSVVPSNVYCGVLIHLLLRILKSNVNVLIYVSLLGVIFTLHLPLCGTKETVSGAMPNIK
jgi:hypothetical protein